MARINIEDSIHTDRRFLKLIQAVGCADRAMGALVRAWMLAQKWYLSPEQMIPLEEWQKQEIPDAVIECGLAKSWGITGIKIPKPSMSKKIIRKTIVNGLKANFLAIYVFRWIFGAKDLPLLDLIISEL